MPGAPRAMGHARVCFAMSKKPSVNAYAGMLYATGRAPHSRGSRARPRRPRPLCQRGARARDRRTPPPSR
eukprot:6009502-Lingulodinium_polyedra.AAC.1